MTTKEILFDFCIQRIRIKVYYALKLRLQYRKFFVVEFDFCFSDFSFSFVRSLLPIIIIIIITIRLTIHNRSNRINNIFCLKSTKCRMMANQEYEWTLNISAICSLYKMNQSLTRTIQLWMVQTTCNLKMHVIDFDFCHEVKTLLLVGTVNVGATAIRLTHHFFRILLLKNSEWNQTKQSSVKLIFFSSCEHLNLLQWN